MEEGGRGAGGGWWLVVGGPADRQMHLMHLPVFV